MSRPNQLPLILTFLATVLVGHAQSIFERPYGDRNRLAIAVLGYREVAGNLEVRTFGTASLYGVPLTTNLNPRIVCVVTVAHNLEDRVDGHLLDGLLLKLNMPSNATPRFLKVPLKHDVPKNYWTSEQGFDLAVIPIPPGLVDGANAVAFRQEQIVTQQRAEELGIVPGLLVQAVCLQPGYFEPFDLSIPETIPVSRYGHLSRLGFYKNDVSRTTVVRPHVIDVHSSPGNSGSTVVVDVPKSDQTVSQTMFLGLVQGFAEEQGAYQPYPAPLTNTSTQATLNLVSADGRSSNTVAMSIKTVANPGLTFVTPVHELNGILNSTNFQQAALLMSRNPNQYQVMNSPVPPSKN